MKFFFGFIGFALIFFGIIALFLPFVQGILLILIGVYFLSLINESVANGLEKNLKRIPPLYRVYSKSRAKIKSVFFK